MNEQCDQYLTGYTIFFSRTLQFYSKVCDKTTEANVVFAEK